MMIYTTHGRFRSRTNIRQVVLGFPDLIWRKQLKSVQIDSKIAQTKFHQEINLKIVSWS